MAEDRLPNDTATDWVTFADHVVVVRVVSEDAGSPAPEEIENGEGLIPRTVTLAVKQTLWSSPNAARETPTTFDWSVHGWVFSDAKSADPMEKATKMAVEEGTRLEVGHDYVVNLQWEEARCDQADGRQPAQWFDLGTRSDLPIDDGIAGVGEREGRVETLEEAQAEVAEMPQEDLPFAYEAVGHDAQWIAARLEQAHPDAQLANEWRDPRAAEYACPG